MPPQLPESLGAALQALITLAPAHLFPRARQLYFNKYPLEGRPEELDLAPVRRFRTFVLRDTLCLPEEGGQASLRINELAVVHWQAPQTNPEDYTTYIRDRWQLQPQGDALTLELCEEPWFREGGAYARLIFRRPPAGPLPAAAPPGSRR